MFGNILKYGFLYLWLRYQAISGKLKNSYRLVAISENDPFAPYARYPFVYRQSALPYQTNESYFEVPLASFQVLTDKANPYKVEFLDNIMNDPENGMPFTVEAYPNGMFKAKRKLVNRTQENFYWN